MAANKNQKFIGVDLGGTNVRAGLVQRGRIVALQKRPISSREKAQVVIDEVCDTIQAVMQPGVTGIGIGVPGAVDANGVLHAVANIPSWKQVPLKKVLERHFGLPVYVNNDAKCFALGELHYGKGRGCRNLVGLIVGTGLGAGVIINGKLFTGSNLAAGEIGHAPYLDEEFEYYCSGRYFKREYGQDAFILQQRADDGDRKAAAILATFGTHFADVIQAVLYAYDPEMIVLGGGVSRAFPYYEKRMREGLKKFRFQNNLAKLKIVQTRKPHIAVLAAAALCLDHG
jgi:glucokinase